MSRPKELQAKRHQHHVWADYLLRWGSGTSKVHYTTKTGKLACDSVRGIVVEDFFYKVTNLSSENIEVIKYISSHSTEFMQKIHMEALNSFLELQKLESEYQKEGVNNEEINEALYALKCNMLENIHSSHENSAKEILSELAKGNAEILKTPETLKDLLLFLAHQFTRTKAGREGITMIANTSETDAAMSQTMSHAWWFISYMYGMNIGANLFKHASLSTHTLLINESNKPFITSDQPVVNVYPAMTESGFTAPEKLDLYYPISPKISFIACESRRFSPGLQSVDVSIVEELNSKIAAQSFIHIIGDSKEAIKPYKKLIGRKYKTLKATQ